MGSSTSDYMFSLIIYFIGLFIIVSLFSISGAFNSGGVVFDDRFSSSLSTATLNNATGNQADDLTMIPKQSYFKDVFSFFFWNINVYQGSNTLITYMWLIRLLFVFLPLLALILTIYYSLPTISG